MQQNSKDLIRETPTKWTPTTGNSHQVEAYELRSIFLVGPRDIDPI